MTPGSGRLEFARAAGRTVVTGARARSPLRLLTPRNHGHGAWAYSTSFGGGLVDGDVLSLDVEVGPGAVGLLATQGPTRVYRSPNGCENRLRGRIAEGGLFVGLLDPTSLFAGARCLQDVAFELCGPTSSLVWLDVLTCGRAARGERWGFSRWDARLRLERGGHVLLDERLLLSDAQGPLAERMGRFDAVGTLVLFGPALAPYLPELWARLRARPLRRRDALQVAVSRVGRSEAPPTSDAPSFEGLLLRFAGRTVETTLQGAHAWLDFLPQLLGDDPRARRP